MIYIYIRCKLRMSIGGIIDDFIEQGSYVNRFRFLIGLF